MKFKFHNTTAREMTKAAAKIQLGIGRQMITGAEFSFGFGDIDRETLESRRLEGNRLIAEALDIIDQKEGK